MKHVKCGYILNAETFLLRIHSKSGYISIADIERCKLFLARQRLRRHERKFAKLQRSNTVK